MPKAPPVPLAVCCMMKLRSSSVSVEPTSLVDILREKLQKRLLKKGYAMNLVPQNADPTLLVHLVRLDEGSRMMRYIMPFVSPAIMEVEGRVATPNARQFKFVQKAQVGLFGGSTMGMMTVNADRLATKIAKEVVKAHKA